MRITADVIDEEPCSSFWASEQVPDKNQKKIKVVLRRSLKGKDDKSYHVIFDKMLKKFQELYLSDFDLTTDTKNTDEEPRDYFTKKGTEMEIVDSVESNKNVPEQASDTPSEWLLQYLHKMKKEITRDVTQNVMQELIGVYDSINDTNDTTAEVGEVVHKGVFCDHCDSLIHGVRYKCGNCVDYDLCQLCENIPNVHDRNHIFLKIRSPLPTPSKVKRRRKKLVKLIPHRDVSNEQNPLLTLRKPKERLKMDAEFLCDLTISDGAVVKPGVTFMKSWKVINSGLKPWTRSTTVKLLWGSEDMKPHKNQVITPMLLPGEEGIVSVMFTSPKVAGQYQSIWGFHHNDQIFGHHIWCSIEVQENLDDASKDNVQEHVSAEKIVEKAQENQRDDKVIQFADALTAVQEVQDRGEVMSRKLAATSHTATPNNTPFDLTPPKSPEPQDSVTKEMKVNPVIGSTSSSFNQETPKQAGLSGSGRSEDGSGLISISSSDSDTEFVIIPMPKCFKLEETVLVPETSESSTAQCSLSSGLPTNCHVSTENESNENELVFEQQVNVDQLRMTNFGLDTTPSERVSQETGAPEVAENICIQTTVEINNVEDLEESSKSTTTIVFPVITADNTDNLVLGTDQPTSNASVVNVQEYKENKESSLPSDTLPKVLISEETPAASAEGKQEGNSVHVLPEEFVTGALNAAVSFYRTAREVISSFQSPGVAEENNAGGFHPIPSMDPMTQLIEMGFCNRTRNEQLLCKHSGDVTLAVAELVNMNDNDWYSSRHAPEHFAFD